MPVTLRTKELITRKQQLSSPLLQGLRSLKISIANRPHRIFILTADWRFLKVRTR
jgi:hypothetical protein